MTNREMLIQALQNYKGEYEEGVVDYLNCPYASYRDCYNSQNGIEYSDDKFKDGCRICKQKWLEKENKE